MILIAVALLVLALVKLIGNRTSDNLCSTSASLAKGGAPSGWGGNDWGQPASGSSPGDINTPGRVAGNMCPVIAISGGHGTTSFFLKPDGTVWGSGRNWESELGQGTANAGTATPVEVLGPGGAGFLGGITAISGGGTHALALKSDGTVWAWGDNTSYQLGDGTVAATRSTPVQVVAGACAAPGPCGGSAVLSGIVAISGGYFHSMALRSDGSVWTWGFNGNGQLGNGLLVAVNTPVQVRAGTCGGGGLCGASPTLTGITAISAGNLFSTAQRSDGSLWEWGAGGFGQLGYGDWGDQITPIHVLAPGGAQGVGPYLTNVSTFVGASDSVIALKSDGTVWDWGRNQNGQLGDNTVLGKNLPVQVLAGACAPGPCGANPNLVGVTMIGAGADHSFAVTSDGSVWAWGLNTQGELGAGNNNPARTPVAVLKLKNVIAFSGGDLHSLALTAQPI